MSIIPLALSILAADAADLLNPIFVLPRSIGPFIADCTIEEQAVDEAAITEHPVEIGAPISDHAYMRPCTVVIRAGWSNSSRNAGGNPNYVRQVYEQFLGLYQEREPFQVVTGKRVYENMLIQRLSQTTDEKTENALAMTVECRQVIIVSTQTVDIPPASAQATPSATQPTVETGPKQLVPAPNANESAFPP